MPLTGLDPRTGARVQVTLSRKQPCDLRARRWVIRELDRLADQQRPAAKRE
jgi:hypothetical protein